MTRNVISKNIGALSSYLNKIMTGGVREQPEGGDQGETQEAPPVGR